MTLTPVHGFSDLLNSEAELRDLLGTCSNLVARKRLRSLDRHCRSFITRSPFAVIATTDADGHVDASPRGDAPGFVVVLDDNTLVIPERPGNRLLDSLRNILDTGRIGLLFVIPGIEETLRVNGSAVVSRAPDLLALSVIQDKKPKVVIGVTVEEAYLHCAKAFRRSHLWDAGTWAQRGDLPTLGKMLVDQVGPVATTVAELDAALDEDYRTTLY